MQKTILAFGEVLWDLLPTGPVLGGAPANFAYRLNSLGTRAILVSRVGDDSLGRTAVEQLSGLQMETGYLQVDPTHPTGAVEVRLDAKGNSDFNILRHVAYDYIETRPDIVELAGVADGFCFGTLIQRAPTSRATLHAALEAAPRALKFLDLNLRRNCYTRESVAESLAAADVLKLNETEVTYLASEFDLPSQLEIFGEEALRHWDLTCCLITLGARGAFVVAESGEKLYSPGYAVPLVDTCGSGDACSAGFMHGWFQGRPMKDCLETGNALGALVATQRGATEPISRDQLEHLRGRGADRVVEPGLERWIE